jgi:hypothetical protein
MSFSTFFSSYLLQLTQDVDMMVRAPETILAHEVTVRMKAQAKSLNLVPSTTKKKKKNPEIRGPWLLVMV